MRRRVRAAIIAAIILPVSTAAGCGGFLGFGSDDEPAANGADDDASSSDGTVNAEGASTVDGAPDVAVDASSDVDAADVTTQGDGRVCVLSGTCAKSVFDCCSEMEEPGAAICGGVCGVDICCF